MRFIRKICLILLAASALTIASIGCDGPNRQGSHMAESPSPANAETQMERKLAGYQYRLLDLALDTATAIPVDPHIKDRSKAQEKVVQAYLELDQPDRALKALEKIENWRRGACYAQLGFYYARTGCLEDAGKYLEEAEKISEKAEDWRRDHINVEVAKALALMGKTQQATEMEAQAENSEKGKIEQAKSMLITPAGFDEQMEKLDALIATGDFDVLNNALGACVELFSRFYEDAHLRSATEDKIRQSWGTLPVFIRMQLQMKLAEAALAHSDQAKSLALVNEAQQQLDDNQWQPEDRIAHASHIAGLRYLAGDQEKAAADAEAIQIFFDQQKDFIVDIWRAEALRPLAEAYQSMGDAKRSLEVYKIAFDEGMKNPNSRPRAEDLSATCISLAMNSVEPDDELWTKIYEIRKGLSSPW